MILLMSLCMVEDWEIGDKLWLISYGIVGKKCVEMSMS